MKIKLLNCIIIIIGLFSCQNQSKSFDSQEQLDTVSTFHTDVKFLKSISLPQVEILLPTQYRKESTGYPKNINDKIWYEIYKDSTTGAWRIAKATLDINYGHDACVDEDVMIIKSNREHAKMFFTPFNGLSEDPNTILEDRMLFPEHKITFRLNGQEYLLSPMGSCLDEGGQLMTTEDLMLTKEEDLDNTIKISNYSLFWGSVGNVKELITIKNMEYSTPRLIWAGDLNQDDLPDLILNLPDFYEGQHFFFFLSDKNDPEAPLKKVAELKVSNDC